MPARQTVLIVEGDQATRRMYERALQQEYQVLVASAEEDVSALLSARTLVHAIVLEPGPLGGWGWALLAELRRHADFESVPLILCTAQDEKRRGLELGATEYLVKPVLPAVLLATVRRVTRPLL
jgi:putative two-component system response regulator